MTKRLSLARQAYDMTKRSSLARQAYDQVMLLHRRAATLDFSVDYHLRAALPERDEGAMGTIAGTGFVRAFTRALVQVPGVASKISVPHLRRAVSKSEAISDLLTRFHMTV